MTSHEEAHQSQNESDDGQSDAQAERQRPNVIRRIDKEKKPQNWEH